MFVTNPETYKRFQFAIPNNEITSESIPNNKTNNHRHRLNGGDAQWSI